MPIDSPEPITPICSNLITPQGDGNVAIYTYPPPSSSTSSNLITPQGDGNQVDLHSGTCGTWFKFNYPARGRKLSKGFVAIASSRTSSNSITPQGGGNNSEEMSPTAVSCSNSITPQGDGNNGKERRGKNENRKLFAYFDCVGRALSFFFLPFSFFLPHLITPQGDGNQIPGFFENPGI